MDSAKLKFEGKEIKIGEGIVTLGRASDNNVPFINDSNVSRYHAEIETQGKDFWLFDLKSSNGTTLNGKEVKTEVLLKNGDTILLGGTSEVVFSTEDDAEESDDENTSTASATATEGADSEGGDDDETDEPSKEAETEESAEDEPKKSSKMTWLFGCAGLTFGLAIISVFAVVLFTQCGSPQELGCSSKAKIVNPTVGDTIAESVKVQVEVEEPDCIVGATFYIDGEEIGKVTESPFAVELDPDKFPNFADGFPHTITVSLEDDTGDKLEEVGKVEELYFETREIEVATTTPTPEDDDPNPKPADTPGSGTTIIELNKLSKDMVSKLPGNAQFAPTAEFLSDVQKLIPEYTAAGYFARASIYRDVINEAYIKEKGLNPEIGYILAMSRTKFILQSSNAGQGIWGMPEKFVTENNYNAGCQPGEMLSTESQNCAAKASAEYLKNLVDGVFDGNVVFSVATFGKSTTAATARKAQLQAAGSNLWGVLTRQERNQVARFFAAGIVTKNPKQFGLKEDRPISELYNFGTVN